MRTTTKWAIRSGTALMAVAAAACAVVAPRRKDAVHAAQWANLARYRYAHRGLHDNAGSAPENSLAAFRLAREAGYGSELDVHVTADDQLVVIHDSNLRRACGVEGTVERLTLEQLREYRLFDSDEPIPTFDEVLDVYEQRDGEEAPPLVVEVKTYAGNREHVTQLVMEALDTHLVQYCVESFDPRVLWWLRKWRPGVIRGQLSEEFLKHGSHADRPERLIAHSYLVGNIAVRPDFVAYRIEDLSNPAVRLACDVLRAPLVIWTVKTPEQLAQNDARGAVSIFEGFLPTPTVS